MIGFKNFIIEDVTPSKNQIRGLENSIFGGIRQVKFAMSYVKDIVSNSQDPQIKNLFDTSLSLYKKIDEGFINKISASPALSSYFKNWTQSNSNSKAFITDLENQLNKSILASKRDESKRNKILEKKKQLDFWKHNQKQIDNLIQFRLVMSKLEDLLLDQKLEK